MALGMYVHTHWGYNHPYAARTWTVEDWRGYLQGLRALGYDEVMFWPLLDSMPARPTPSDHALLARTAQAIDIAQRAFGMRFIITVGPNVMGNALAARHAYEQRPYFSCERKVNPADPAAVEELLAARRLQFAALAGADGIAIIDSDPGGFPGSDNEAFVRLLAAQTDLLRQVHPRAELIYWMWVGWENYNRFWAEAAAQGGEPALHIDESTFTETLALLRARVAEPWSVFAAFPEHLAASRTLGLQHKRRHILYGAIEGEPTFPLTNCRSADIAAAFLRHGDEAFPLGVMGNAQTHCLQLPSLYLFAHFAQGGSADAVDLERFADGLVPALGGVVATGWRALEEGSPEQQRRQARLVREAIGLQRGEGRYAGLLFGSPARFLEDLALNLEVRAVLTDFGEAVQRGKHCAIAEALRDLLAVLVPYQERLGFADAYYGPLYTALNEPLTRLHDADIGAALAQFHDWRSPAVRHGSVLRLLAAAGRWAAQAE